MLMTFILFFKWWYSKGWVDAFKQINLRSKNIAQEMSLPILFKTLFEPWKQLITSSAKDASLDDKMRILFDNLFARAFGFVIRTGTIIISIILILLVAVLSIVLAILWPVIPFLPLVFVYLGVV